MPVAGLVVFPVLLAGGTAGTWTTPAPLRACGAVLSALAGDVVRAASAASAEAKAAAARQHAIDAELAMVKRIADTGEVGTPCESAKAFLSTNVTLEGDVRLRLRGNDGAIPLDLTSGTSMATIIAGINKKQHITGVSASRALLSTSRIELRSIMPGVDQFVSVRQDGPRHEAIIFPGEIVGDSVLKLTDFGEAGRVGDVDCDDRVAMSDVVAILRAWGACNRCPEDVNGDGLVDAGDITLVLEHWDDS